MLPGAQHQVAHPIDVSGRVVKTVIDCSLADCVVGSSRRHDLEVQLGATERPDPVGLPSWRTRSASHSSLVEVIEQRPRRSR